MKQSENLSNKMSFFRFSGVRGLLLLLIVLFASCAKQESKDEIISRVFKLAEVQYNYLIEQIDTISPLKQPRGMRENDRLFLVNKEDWTSGFFPGSLWYLYEYSQKPEWKNRAIRYTMALDSAQFITWNHDVGFMIQNSYGNAFRLDSQKTVYKQAVIDAAKSLITRYRPVAGIIQSWDTGDYMGWIAKRGWDMPVIIDNMMNLNLLFETTKLTGDSIFYKIALTHANTTIKHHFRPDFSSYHVIDYDHKTGEVRSKQTAQGYSHPSSWARGQAWGLYGFTECYAETKNEEYLKQAIAIANYIIHNPKIPENGVPYWDYDDPKIPNAPRDASAAAISASALLELQQFDTENRKIYLEYAEKILRSLASPDFLATEKENGGFILKHSVGNYHTGEELDKPLNYADYYFLEALLRWSKVTPNP